MQILLGAGFVAIRLGTVASVSSVAADSALERPQSVPSSAPALAALRTGSIALSGPVSRRSRASPPTFSRVFGVSADHREGFQRSRREKRGRLHRSCQLWILKAASWIAGGPLAVAPEDWWRGLFGEIEFVAFVGIDWADQKHAWALQIPGHPKVERGDLDHTPEAIEVWAAELARGFGDRIPCGQEIHATLW